VEHKRYVRTYIGRPSVCPFLLLYYFFPLLRVLSIELFFSVFFCLFKLRGLLLCKYVRILAVMNRAIVGAFLLFYIFFVIFFFYEKIFFLLSPSPLFLPSFTHLSLFTFFFSFFLLSLNHPSLLNLFLFTLFLFSLLSLVSSFFSMNQLPWYL
jgi:hypothetical protein